MLILWTFFVFSQDPTKKINPTFTPNPILRIIEKAPGTSRQEKALNYVEDLCQSVGAQVQEKKTVRPKDKELVKKELDTLAKAFALAKKDMTEANYSSAMGAMSRFVIFVRTISGQDFYGEAGKKLRDNCARVMDEMRPGVFIPEDLEGFIERAKGKNERVKTISGIGFFCQAIRDSVLENENLLPSQEEDLVARSNAFILLTNARVAANGVLTIDQWQELVKTNLDFFSMVALVTKSDNQHGKNYKNLHGVCHQALNKIKPQN